MRHLLRHLVFAASLLSVIALAASVAPAQTSASARRAATAKPAFHVLGAMPVNTNPVLPGGLHTTRNGNGNGNGTGTGWNHGNVDEIGDLCAWTFGNYWSLNGGYANEAWGPNGQDLYLVQTEWDQSIEAWVTAGP